MDAVTVRRTWGHSIIAVPPYDSASKTKQWPVPYLRVYSQHGRLDESDDGIKGAYSSTDIDPRPTLHHRYNERFLRFRIQVTFSAFSSCFRLVF